MMSIEFDKSFASQEKSKFWSNKNVLNPYQCFKFSSKKFIFDCDKCDHEFIKTLSSINVSWCPFCSRQKLCENNDCIDCFNKSFASIEKSKFWSNKNIKTPRECFKTTNTKYIFNCEKCNHEIEMSLSLIVYGSWCCYCGNKKLCNEKDCIICFEKSFASHPKHIFWSDKNELTPRQVFKNSLKKMLFNCDCNHDFEIIIANITNLNNWCSYCCNPPQKLCDNNDCETCFNKSFANYSQHKFWSDKNLLKPRQVFKGTNHLYIFDCNKCNKEFECALKYIVYKNTWCPFCKYKTENIVNNYLSSLYTVEIQKSFEWCKNKRKLPFDFCIEEFKLIIELDGFAHFKDILFWNSKAEDVQKIDKLKMLKANENGYSIIRILQEDVFFNKIDWKFILKNSIKLYKTPSIIYHYNL